jgi:hypothetical protein
MFAPKQLVQCAAVISLLAPLSSAYPQQQQNGYRLADQQEKTNYLLSMEKIRKLGEVEKVTQEIFDKDTDVRDAWNDHGIGAQGSMAADVRITEKEFPQIAAAIHKAGFSTREYVVCFLTLSQAQQAVSFKKEGKTKEYPPYVNPANIKLLEEHREEIIRIMNPPRNGSAK